MTVEKEELHLPVFLWVFFPTTTDKVPETINCLQIESEAHKGMLSLNHLFLIFPWLADT